MSLEPAWPRSPSLHIGIGIYESESPMSFQRSQQGACSVTRRSTLWGAQSHGLSPALPHSPQVLPVQRSLSIRITFYKQCRLIRQPAFHLYHISIEKWKTVYLSFSPGGYGFCHPFTHTHRRPAARASLPRSAQSIPCLGCPPCCSEENPARRPSVSSRLAPLSSHSGLGR